MLPCTDFQGIVSNHNILHFSAFIYRGFPSEEGSHISRVDNARTARGGQLRSSLLVVSCQGQAGEGEGASAVGAGQPG